VHQLIATDLIVDARVLSTVEIGVGCAMGSLVTLKPLFRRLFRLGSTYKYGSASHGIGGRRSNYANQLHSLDNMESQSRANDGVLPLYPVTTTHVLAGKKAHSGRSRSNEWERSGDDESLEARGGRIHRDVTYTITHDKS
jgi:hypothetical protein